MHPIELDDLKYLESCTYDNHTSAMDPQPTPQHIPHDPTLQSCVATMVSLTGEILPSECITRYQDPKRSRRARQSGKKQFSDRFKPHIYAQTKGTSTKYKAQEESRELLHFLLRGV
jgi:hypothetical protein